MYSIPVSTGEIVDKITILEIKQDNIKDDNKLNNIVNELMLLKKIIDISSVYSLYLELKEINQKLWNIEDNLRVKEKNKEFDKEFVELARSVYYTNDERAAVKKQINILTNSELVEEKSYEEY